ncbi:MAG: Rpn family recombination-promoting nuclease/putative transposase [Selenomonas sp.]|nr:Rpn family recombination-promoting nuclease/putative transposase [Selenomonas sp.]
MKLSKEPPHSSPKATVEETAANYLKPWEDLTIADDYMFKLVMSHMHICKHLLELILNVKIRKLVEPETEKAMKIGYESKGVRLDVYVEDEEGTVYDVEMQVRRYPEAWLGRRTRYYQSVIDFGALQVGTEYHQLKKSIIIFICPFKIFDGKRHIYTFSNLCLQNKKLALDDGSMKIFLSTKGKMKDVPAKVKNFLKFVDGLPVKDSWVDELQELIAELKTSEREKANYMTYQMKIAEVQSEARAEAKAEERKIGIKSLIATAKAFAATPAQAVEQLMKNYPLSEEEAKAAVQANW